MNKTYKNYRHVIVSNECLDYAKAIIESDLNGTILQISPANESDIRQIYGYYGTFTSYATINNLYSVIIYYIEFSEKRMCDFVRRILYS